MLKKSGFKFFLIVTLCLSVLVSCSLYRSSLSLFKRSAKPAPAKAPAEGVRPLSGGPEEVKKQMGEPDNVIKTPEGRILWLYKPGWKIMPDDRGNTYVEFEDGKVTRVFRKE